jgi:hypothetical protein
MPSSLHRLTPCSQVASFAARFGLPAAFCRAHRPLGFPNVRRRVVGSSSAARALGGDRSLWAASVANLAAEN